MDNELKFYRYDIVEYASTDIDGEYIRPLIPNPKLELREYNLHKETEKGFWIGHGSTPVGKLRGYSRWVSKTSRKRHAYPTKEEALTNFIKRNQKRVRILKWQTQVCTIAIEKAKQLQTNYDKIN